MAYVFDLVITTSLYASVAGLVVLIVKRLLRNRLSAGWHYLIWLVLIIKLLAPFGPESAVSLFNNVPAIPAPETPGFSRPAGQALPAAQTTTGAQINLPPEQPAKSAGPANLTAALPHVWAAGAGCLALWLIFSFCSLHRKLGRCSTTTDERALRILEACKIKMGINKRISLIVQDTIPAPSLSGILTPRILLSPAALRLSDRDLAYVLMHELAHYKRKDIAANYLLLILQTIHWFNPVIWYCFRRIRQDMELAADERVLSVLNDTEHGNYGRALLAVLEGAAPSKLSFELLSVADEKKNIERRLKMIIKAGFFKRRRGLTMLSGIVCLAVLGVLLLTNGLTGQERHLLSNPGGYSAEVLFKYKTTYVGDNSKVANLISSLPYAGRRGEISLQTASVPYGVTVDYDFSGAGPEAGPAEHTFHNNAAVMFALIANVDVITFNVRGGAGPSSYMYSRSEVQQGFDRDLREYAQDINSLETLLNNLSLTLHVHPAKYALIMSSTPGIQIRTEYSGPAAKVRYSTGRGVLFNWENTTGKVPAGKPVLELPLSTPVYWSPRDLSGWFSTDNNYLVTAAVIDGQGQTIAEKAVTIVYDGSLYYTVEPARGIIAGQDLDVMAGLAIKDRGSAYAPGEVATEGHVILDREENNGTVKLYTIASYGAFGFENGVFTKISGSGAVPTVMTFSRNEYGEYSLLEYREPMDGAGYADSIKKMFPRSLQDRALSCQQDYNELVKQQEAQAAAYLRDIGRPAEVRAAYVEKKYPDLNKDAYYTLFGVYAKHDSFINSCPDWIGTRERVEDGVRYIYETSLDKTGDGYDLIILKKKSAEGTVIEERRYKITEGGPQLENAGS